MMTREDFQIALLKQYSQAIDEVVLDCEHLYRAELDLEMLSVKMENILTAAKLDGLDEGMMWYLIQSKVPSYYDYAMGINVKIAA